MIDVISILYYLCFLLLGVLSVLIFIKNSKSKINLYFALFTAFMLVWLVTLFIYYKGSSTFELTIIGRANFAAIAIAVVFGSQFSEKITRITLFRKYQRFYHRFVLLETIALAAIIQFTPLIAAKEERVNGEVITLFGPLFLLFIAHLVFYIGSGIYTVYKAMKGANDSIRNQLQVILFGFTTTALVSITTNIILPFGFNIFTLEEIGALSVMLLIGSIAYAITVHHLFDIRIVIKRTIIYATLLSFVFATYAVIVLLLTRAFGGASGQSVNQNFIPNLMATLVIGFSLEPLRHWISERTDQWLFQKEYKQQSVLKDLGQKLNNVVGLDEALESVMQTIAKVLHLKHAVTYVFQPGENNTMGIKRVKQVGYASSAKLILEDRDFTVQYFSQNSAICLTSDLHNELEQEEELIDQKKADATFIRQHAIKQAVLKKLDSLEVASVVPLHLNNQPLGLLLLSEKLSGETFHTQDLALLELVGAQAISSIQKAKLYEGDQMKSEFVSIASHELLTPISAIEGYLSMILEENIGKVDPQARDYLNKVYTSAKRLSLLIKDLLSVSRIESGKMKVDLQQLDIAKMIKDTLDQLKFVAADKKLEMKFVAPEKALPPVWADPDRTMQILVNLVSNAIKYTPSGTVSITATPSRDGMVSVAISDTGLGMNKDQMSHLFTKFYRVDTPETTGIMGTGLGLYITKSIIEKMGGTITCKSTVGQGSTFTFTLPIFKVETSVVA
jgi:signal transduction histidine kinase